MTIRRAACAELTPPRLGVLAALALAIALLAAPTAHAKKGPGQLLTASPPAHAMVVSANLKASFNKKYINSSGPRMRQFVVRLLDQIYQRGGQWKPDVLLLQEALNRRFKGGTIADDLSATRVASELTKQTGDPYAIVVDPGRRQRPAPGVSKETAIVANMETMEWPTAAGFVTSNAFKKKFAFKGPGPRSGARAPSRRQAWAVIAESDPKGVVFPVASVHFLTDKRLGCTKGAPCQPKVNRLKARWSAAVSGTLQGWSGDAFKRAVIAGDWNATRKERWYGDMIGLGFRKAIRGRIDYIFTRGELGLTGIDDSFHTGRGAYPLGYSDHRFLWAAVG
jgi:hypothetical protein